MKQYKLSITLQGGVTFDLTSPEQVVRDAMRMLQDPDRATHFEVWGDEQHALIRPSAVVAIRVSPPLPKVEAE